MPEMHFKVRWPDHTVTRCYSPSSTIRDAFAAGQPYPVREFVERSRAALEHGSERVRLKYGYGCGHAAAQIREIASHAAAFLDDPQARVVVESFED